MKKIIAAVSLVFAGNVAALPSVDYMCQYLDSPQGREYYTTVIKYRNANDGNKTTIEINGFVMEQGKGNDVKFDHGFMASFRSNVGVAKIPLNEDNCSILEYPEF